MLISDRQDGCRFASRADGCSTHPGATNFLLILIAIFEMKEDFVMAVPMDNGESTVGLGTAVTRL